MDASPHHPVIQEVLLRKSQMDAGILPGPGAAKLGLVVEGGGMRGVYSGGALVGMAEMGLSSVFDKVFAESAGAINASYYLSGQAHFGIRIYSEDLQSLEFINPLRIGRLLNVDYVIDEVLTKRKPLDIEALKESPSGFYIALTNADDGTPRLVDVKGENLPLLTILRATSAITPLYGTPVLIDGVPYVDGGISNPIPVQSAIDAGCTHILVLLTRPVDFILQEYQGLERWFISWLLGSRPTHFLNTFYKTRPSRYNAARDLVFGRASAGEGIHIAYIGPDATSPRVTRNTLVPARLRAAAREMAGRVQTAFGWHRPSSAGS